MSPQARSMRTLGVVFVFYALLCATHLGEFWPFSIYPMFSSSAGQPWSRAVVRELPVTETNFFTWQEETLETLPGEPVLLASKGAIQNDVANYVSKTKEWDEEHVEGLRALLSRHIKRDKQLLVYRVQGQLTGRTAVHTRAIPVLLITPAATHLNPVLQSGNGAVQNASHSGQP